MTMVIVLHFQIIFLVFFFFIALPLTKIGVEGGKTKRCPYRFSFEKKNIFVYLKCDVKWYGSGEWKREKNVNGKTKWWANDIKEKWKKIFFLLFEDDNDDEDVVDEIEIVCRENYKVRALCKMHEPWWIM